MAEKKQNDSLWTEIPNTVSQGNLVLKETLMLFDRVSITAMKSGHPTFLLK